MTPIERMSCVTCRLGVLSSFWDDARQMGAHIPFFYNFLD